MPRSLRWAISSSRRAGADGELVVDRAHSRRIGDQPQIADAGEGAVIAAGDLAAAGVVLVEERQPAVEHRRLQAVEPAVGADLVMGVAHASGRGWRG